MLDRAWLLAVLRAERFAQGAGLLACLVHTMLASPSPEQLSRAHADSLQYLLARFEDLRNARREVEHHTVAAVDRTAAAVEADLRVEPRIDPAEVALHTGLVVAVGRLVVLDRPVKLYCQL